MYRKIVIIALAFNLPTLFNCQLNINAKKIKQVHKIETPNGRKVTDNLLIKKPKRIYANESLTSNNDSLVSNATSLTSNVTDSILIHSNNLKSITDSISFSGYDKPAPSSKESFHITNSSATQINKAGIRITYLDLKNRMLHSRDVEVNCCVPSGESRLTSIPSWDIQHTFFYYLGPEPKKVATPYKVAIKLLWVEI